MRKISLKSFDINIGVNIGARHLQSPSFATYLQDILSVNPEVSPTYLELELLETSALQDIARVSHIIKECKLPLLKYMKRYTYR